MHGAIRQRLKEALRAHRIDAYLACTPSNLHYASGFQSAFIDLSWQMTGTDMVLVPSADELAPVLIVSEYCAPVARSSSDIEDIRTYPLWTEGRDFAVVADADPRHRIDRPEQYDTEEIFGLVRDALSDRGLAGGRIGSDLALMKHGTFEALRRALPDNELVDCEDILYRVRSIKHPGEIERLRGAARLFDAGVAYSGECLRDGQKLYEIRDNFDAGVARELRQYPELGSRQASFFFPHVGTGSGTVARRGDIVKLDCGIKLDGYWSDGCRNFCIGAPGDRQQRVYDALRAGYEAALPLMRPGTPMREIYDVTLEAVRAAGLPNYSRGHFGHSIGMDDQTEEPPFIGPNEEVLEPGMVLCLEVPYYPADVGGFNIEDMLVITDGGHELLTHLPRDLVSV
jgi:Xaa-Pro dipeptidase